MEALMEGWAQYYSEELSRKIQRGMHDTAMKCKSTGSTPPLGYKVGADRKYEIDEDVAPVIVRCFELYLEGSTFTELTRYLTDHGIRTGKGNPYNGTAVKRMLTSRRYIGEYKYSDVVIEGGMPSIVSEDLFYMVQKKIKKDHPPQSKNADYLLSGKLYCGLCGKNYKGVSGTSKTGRKYYYYKCTGKNCEAPQIPARPFEKWLSDEVAAALRDPEMLDLISEKLHLYWERTEESEPSIDDPSKELSRIEKQLDAIVASLEKRPGSDTLLNRLDELESKRDELRADIAISQGKTAENSRIPSASDLREGIDAFLAGFSFDEPEKTTERILEGFVRKVVKTNKKILVELNLSGVEPLELEDLIEFDQNSDWWR